MSVKRKAPIKNRLIREPNAPTAPILIDLSSAENDNRLKWMRTWDPLQGLSIDQAKAIYDQSLAGNYSRLQGIYDRLEGSFPELMLCVERRSAALLELDWTTHVKDLKKVRDFDSELANEQAAYLAFAYGEAEDENLYPTVEHMASAFFRGFAVSIPIFGENGTSLIGFTNIDHWNICRDPTAGNWYFNKDCIESADFKTSLPELPASELLTVSRPRHVDLPALSIAIRAGMGEDLYGKMLGRYGIPPVLITLPEKIGMGKLAEFAEQARKVNQGGTGAIPFGSEVQWASPPAGVAPFEAFLSYQVRQIILLATGGLATSLDALGGLGSSVGDAHEATWATLIQRDAAIISTAMNKNVTRRLLDAQYPGKPHLAAFDFETEIPATAKEVLELAGLAKNAGLEMDTNELQQRTGYTLTRAFTPYVPPQPGVIR